MRKAAFGTIAAVLLLAAAFHAQSGPSLDIYFIDVEGGQSTLIVAPSGESLLVDTGYAGNDGRDPGRVMAAANAAGIKKIDYLLITHFHADHLGGAPELSKLIPIGTFVDHDTPPPTTAPGVVEPYRAYVAVRTSGRHINAKPGDRIPVKGLDVQVVSSATEIVSTPLAAGGQTNALCEPAARPPGEPLENPRSTGVHLRFGRFRFLTSAISPARRCTRCSARRTGSDRWTSCWCRTTGAPTSRRRRCSPSSRASPS